MDALMLGISGLRGTIGGTLPPSVALRWASAFAAYLKQNEQPANGKHFVVVFGRDSRPSGSFVRDAAVSAAPHRTPRFRMAIRNAHALRIT